MRVFYNKESHRYNINCNGKELWCIIDLLGVLKDSPLFLNELGQKRLEFIYTQLLDDIIKLDMLNTEIPFKK